eukprot:scaffold1916_cov123-Isochrysis_galbana.AAC.18
MPPADEGDQAAARKGPGQRLPPDRRTGLLPSAVPRSVRQGAWACAPATTERPTAESGTSPQPGASTAPPTV